MKPYLLSLVVGLMIGIIYSFSGVRSPAPPAIALIGLLGILVGEKIMPFVKEIFQTPVENTINNSARTSNDAKYQ